jgi:hypothetical protein
MSPLPSASVQPKLIPKQSSRLEVTVSVGSTVYSVAFSPDGTRIVTGSYDHTAKVWDAQGGEELLTLKGHSDRADSVAFSPDGRRIVTGSTDRTARVWDAQSGKELLALNVGSTVNSVAFSPNGMRIVTGGDDATARVWDAQGGKELLMLNVGSTVNSVAFSPDGSRVATGSGDATAKVWDAQSGKELLTLKGHFYSVNSVTFSPDGTRVVSGSLDGTAKLWDVHSGQALLTFSFGGQVNSVAFSPDGSRISTGGDGSTAKVWDAQSGKELLTLKERSSGVNSVAFSPDGTRIVTGNLDGTAKVWGFGDTASKLAPTVKPSVSIAPSVEPLSPSPVASVQPKAVVEQRSQRPTKPTTLDFASITKEQPYVNSLGMKFVPVPGTNVLFSVWDTRVKDYKVFAEATKREWPKLGFKQTDEHPAVNVTWNDAKAFCMWLTNTERAAGRISDQQDYRLPTDGEWSAAVGKTKYPWGDQWPPPREAGNYGSSLHIDDYKFTSPVGAFAPNAAGLYDVGGNVWQWCEDWYAKQMNEKAILDKHRDLRDDGGGHTQHLVRGASWWVSDATYMLSSTRMGGGSPNYRNANNGFRCVLSESTIPSRTEDKSSSPAESLSSSAPPNDTGASEATPIPSPSSQIATSPPAPEQTALAKNGRTWQAWIGDFVRQFVAADQLNDANATLALYAATVDYFDDHQADQAFIRQDIEKSNERWPVRRDSIEGDIHLQEKVPDKEYVASFKRNRYAESAPHALWTKGQLAIDLDITVTDGIPKISGIKAKMLHQEKGKPTPVTSNSPTPANLPRRSAYGIPVPGKPGLVKSPYAPSKGLVDVRRYRKGAEVKCPFTGKIFVVP